MRLPGPVELDPLFLFYLPVRENSLFSWLLWGGLILLTIGLAALPWTRRRKIQEKSSAVELHRVAATQS